MNYPKNSLKVELGYSGTNTKYGMIRADEFTSELKGTRGIKKYREMRDGDATIGSIMYATEQVLRDVPRIVVPSDKKNAKSVEMAKWLETVFDDMEHTLDDHISEALSSLTFGFALFEPVYKIRGGPDFVESLISSTICPVYVICLVGLSIKYVPANSTEVISFTVLITARL